MSKKTQRSDLTGSRTLGGRKFAAISAVEGLKLSAAGKERIDAARAKGRTHEEIRRTIREAYASSKGR